jgi:hypothetical protein
VAVGAGVAVARGVATGVADGVASGQLGGTTAGLFVTVCSGPHATKANVKINKL